MSDYRQALGGAVDPIEHEAMQMDVQIISGCPCPSPRWGRLAAVQNRSRRFCERLTRSAESHRAALGFDAFESRLFDQKAPN